MKQFLIKNQTEIVNQWKEAVIETYEGETVGFLKKKKDQFDNPVGHTIMQCIEKLYDGLINEADAESVEELIDPLVRIRAIQDFSPSQAVGFIFLLKKIIRQQAGSELHKEGQFKELLVLESQIDDFALTAFDVYTKCRNKIHEIKTHEIRKRSRGLLDNPKMRVFLEKRGEAID